MKFNDLSIQEKAAVIKLGVGGGLRSLLEIRLFWDGMPDDPPVILKVNKSQADFVLRLKDPNREYIRDWLNPGDIATHKLSYEEDPNGNTFVFPYVQRVKNGSLVDFSRPPYMDYVAPDRAMEVGDTVRMTPEEAEWFTTHYKDYYPGFNKYAYGGPKKKLKSPELILAEKYGIESVVDNTNFVQLQAFTPQEKSYSAALDAFRERHSSPKAEQRALQQAYDAVMEQKAAEFGTIGTPLSNDLQYSWRRFKNAKGSELLYPVAPSLMFGIDIADKLKEGDYVGAGEDLLLDAAFTYAPEIGVAIKNKLNSGINLLRQSNFRLKVPYKNQNYYRVVYGDKAIDDAIQSGLIRGSETYPEGAYFYKGKPYYATSSKDIRIIEGDPNVVDFVEPNLFRYLDEEILKGINSGNLNAGDYVFRPYEAGNYQNGVEILPIDNSKLHYEALPYHDGKTHVPSNLFNYWKRAPIIGWRKYNFSKGGSIHIKPENRGKFNATKKRTGKSTEELTHSKNPLTRKRAIFALNMAKIRRKHEYGGFIQGMEYDLDPIDIQQLINLGYEIEYI